MQIEDFYKPQIIEDWQIAGLSTNFAAAGETVQVLEKTFISSLDDNFSMVATELLSLILPFDSGSSVNRILVIIKPNNKAYIYQNFPFGTRVIFKKSIEPHRFVFKKDIADIISVFFKDKIADLNPENGDRIIWLFRQNWNFGLFFDFTGKLKAESVLKEMGGYYRKLCYLTEYLFLEKSSNLDVMIQDGWFPFVALIGDGINEIRIYYEEGKKHPSIIKNLILTFDEKRLTEMVSRWWTNSLFNSKKKILKAGITSYLQGNEEGYINGVKNLATELEGIIRVGCISIWR